MMTNEQERALNNLKTIATRLCNDTDFVRRDIVQACKEFGEDDIWSNGIVDFIDCAVRELDRLCADLKKSVTEEEQSDDDSR